VPSLTPERIVDRYIAIAGGGGIETATIRTIATDLGVSIGAVQHHYRTREALLVDAFRETVRRIDSRIEPRALRTLSVSSLIRNLHELLPLDAPRRGEAQVYLQLGTSTRVSEDMRAVRDSSRFALIRWLSAAARRLGIDDEPGQVAMAEAIALLVDGATVRLLDATAGAEVVDAFDGAVRAVVTWHVERPSQGPAS
jgi:AcrR family transcriptional regulator